jgi:probable DNA metabolism protein
MTTVVYDGTFEGFLAAVFDIYEHRFKEVLVASNAHVQANVFHNMHVSAFDPQKAERVWKGLCSKLSVTAQTQLYKAFLSENKGIENLLLRYIQYAFDTTRSIENDYSNADVLTVAQTAKKVHREKHRMEAFVRFQLTADNLYYAICQPDFNVLPLILKHFKNRYADQRWLIYDTRRKFGIYYDLTNVETVTMCFDEQTNHGKNLATISDTNEELYKSLWQVYFNSVNISARKNTRLHIQHMPRRYWKFLPEKQL